MLDVPVEQAAEICLQVECNEAEIVELLAGAVVWNILHESLHRVDFDIGAVVEEDRRDKAAKYTASQNAQRIRENRIASSENCVHVVGLANYYKTYDRFNLFAMKIRKILMWLLL